MPDAFLQDRRLEWRVNSKVFGGRTRRPNTGARGSLGVCVDLEVLSPSWAERTCLGPHTLEDVLVDTGGVLSLFSAATAQTLGIARSVTTNGVPTTLNGVSGASFKAYVVELEVRLAEFTDKIHVGFAVDARDQLDPKIPRSGDLLGMRDVLAKNLLAFSVDALHVFLRKRGT